MLPLTLYLSLGCCVSFNEATESALNALHKFVMSAFPTRPLSYAHKAGVDGSDHRVTIQKINAKERGGCRIASSFFFSSNVRIFYDVMIL